MVAGLWTLEVILIFPLRDMSEWARSILVVSLPYYCLVVSNKFCTFAIT